LFGCDAETHCEVVQSFVDILTRMGEGVSRDQIKGAKSLDQSSSNKVYKKMMCLLVTGSIRNVGKEGDNLLLMKAKDPEESLCADNKDVFEKMDDGSHLPATFYVAHERRKGAPSYGPLWWWIMRAMLFFPTPDTTAVKNLMSEMRWINNDEGPQVAVGVEDFFLAWGGFWLQTMDLLIAQVAGSWKWNQMLNHLVDSHSSPTEDSQEVMSPSGIKHGGGHWKGFGWMVGHISEDSMEEFREKCPTALGKWKDNNEEADAVLKEWPQDKGDVPKHYALELPEERRGDSQNPDNQSAGVRALT